MPFAQFFYGIPIIGHGLAGINAICGNENEAKKALKAANRSTAVIAGGLGGALVGGPIGMVSGAVATGTALDSLESAANGRPEGVIRGLHGIACDLGNGRVPITSTLLTGLYVAGDAISGVTGGNIGSQIPQSLATGIAQSVAKETGNEIGKEVIKEIIKNGSQNALCSATSRTLADNIDHDSSGTSSGRTGNSTGNSSSKDRSNSYSRSNSRKKSQNDCTTPGGDEPPKNNKNFKSSHEQDTVTESHFEVFFKLFGDNVTSLNDIRIAGVYLFREITSGLPTDRGRKNSLKRLIISLRSSDILERVIEAVRGIFRKMDRSDVNFQNFLCLSEMVATYVSENLARRRELQMMEDTPFDLHFTRSMNMFFNLQEKRSILSMFNELREQVSDCLDLIKPTFGNITTAVTHYYKHKFVPASARVLSVREYFKLIKDLLKRVKKSTQYEELVRGTRRRLVYDVYRVQFGRRVRLVLQMQNGKVVVSSCHILDVIIKFDEEDGDEEFDPTY